MRGGLLYLNGERRDEPYINELAQYTLQPLTVPARSVPVLSTV